jgi:asparagine synthase (glutamine-hydrolysing)
MDSVHISGLAGTYAPAQPLTAREMERRLAGERNVTIHAEEELALASFSSAPLFAATVAGTCAVLVGELHDVDELAASLGSDTQAEVPALLAQAYQRFGEQALEQLRGDFALVLWDSQARRGCIAQSRTGIHTLYICASGHQLAFATEIDVLQRLLPRRRAPDEVAILMQLAGRELPGDRTVYEGIRRLGPGQCITLSDGRQARRRYWAPRYAGVSDASPSELQEELWSLVQKAVRRRIDHKGTTAIIMSGGIDSAAVAGAAAAVSAGKAELRSYSGVFPDRPEVDESARIDALAASTGIPTTKCAVAPEGVVAVCLEYLRAFDLPAPGPGYLLEYSLTARAAADGATVVLDGQGGDEVFGTSPYMLADLLRAGHIGRSLRMVRQLPGGEHASRANLLRMWRMYALKAATPHALQLLARRLRAMERYSPDWIAEQARPRLEQHTDRWAWKALKGPRWWAYRADLLLDAREQMKLAEYVRHRAAAAGLQARPPLFDADLVEHALRIPPQLNLDRRFDRPLVRGAMAGRVPDSVRLWPTKSSLAPWYHDALAGREFGLIRRLLLARDAETRAYTEHQRLRALLERPPQINQPGWLPWMLMVWRLLIFECWLRQQSDGRFAVSLLEAGELTPPRYSATVI